MGYCVLADVRFPPKLCAALFCPLLNTKWLTSTSLYIIYFEYNFALARELSNIFTGLFITENVLNSFIQQNEAWRSCGFFLNHTKNHYVLMYALSVFEVRVSLLIPCILASLCLQYLSECTLIAYGEQDMVWCFPDREDGSSSFTIILPDEQSSESTIIHQE